MVASCARSPWSAPGRPTLVRPVRMGDWPVMNAARPAVQLCWPYQSVNIAPSFANRSMFGVRYPITPWLYALTIEPPDVIAPDDQNVGLLPGLRFSHVRLLVCLPNARRDRRERQGKTGSGVPRADDGQNSRFCEQIATQAGPWALSRVRRPTTGCDRSPNFATSGR